MNLVLLIVGLLVVLVLLGRYGSVLIAARAGGEVGRKALSGQPDQIHLSPAPMLPWQNTSVAEGISAQIQSAGFEESGTFLIPEMPGVVVRLYANPDEQMYAAVYEHPRLGVWFDFVSRYQDGTAATFTSAPPSGLDPRPGFVMEHAPGASVLGLLARARTERPDGLLRTLPAKSVPREFENAYLEHVSWLKNRGISKREVMKVAARKAA